MNPAALKLAHETFMRLVQDGHQGGCILPEASLKIINEALAQARLEGARAMQEAAAAHIEPTNPRSDWTSLAIHGNQLALMIRAIDPQQVINESVKS